MPQTLDRPSALDRLAEIARKAESNALSRLRLKRAASCYTESAWEWVLADPRSAREALFGHRTLHDRCKALRVYLLDRMIGPDEQSGKAKLLSLAIMHHLDLENIAESLA